MRAQEGPQEPGPQGQGEAHKSPAGPQGPGLQEPRRAHEGPGGAHKRPGGAQGPRPQGRSGSWEPQRPMGATRQQQAQRNSTKKARLLKEDKFGVDIALMLRLKL